MAAKAAEWKRYRHIESGEIVSAFEIRDVQQLIGGGVELIGRRGERVMVPRDFRDEWNPKDGEFCLRRRNKRLMVGAPLAMRANFVPVPNSVRHKPCPLCRELRAKLKALLDECPA